MPNYDKWDAMERELEEVEKEEKIASKAKNKANYEKKQLEKQKKWEADRRAKGIDKSEDHQHKPTCGCGFADPETLMRLKKEAENKPPELPLEERNVKKMAAIEATREHGKILFLEGKYDHAFAVYERGIMIINGTYGMSEEDFKKIAEHELALDLNMAACKLKLKEWKEAINNCKQALGIDKKSLKAMYRMGQAHMGMADYDEARRHMKMVLDIDAKNSGARKALIEIKELKAAQDAKQRQFDLAMQKRIADAKAAEALKEAKAENLRAAAEIERKLEENNAELEAAKAANAAKAAEIEAALQEAAAVIKDAAGEN